MNTSRLARDPVTGEEAVQRRERHTQAALVQSVAQLLQGDVAALRVQRQDRVRMGLNAPRPCVAALRFCRTTARAAALIVSADHRRGGQLKPTRRSPATHPLVNRTQRSRRQVHR